MTYQRKEVIGDCTLYLGDCRDVLPTLGTVDAVVYNEPHENAAKGQCRSQSGGGEDLGAEAPRDRGEIRQRSGVSGGYGDALRGDVGGLSESAQEDGASGQVARQIRTSEWSLQGRDQKHGLSDDGREVPLQSVRGDGRAGDPPHGRGSHEQHPGQSGGALFAVPFEPSQARMVGRTKGICLVTDPPYGIGAGTGIGKVTKEGSDFRGREQWDDSAPDRELFDYLISLTDWQIIWGDNYFGLPASPCFFVWDKIQPEQFTLAMAELAWTNIRKPAKIWRWKSQSINGGDPKHHPTQKPEGLMRWCIAQLPDDNSIVLDPFMGSGTTGVACVNLGRSFIGIEREPTYFDIACRRIEEAYKQPRLFDDQPAPKPVQPSFLDHDK